MATLLRRGSLPAFLRVDEWQPVNLGERAKAGTRKTWGAETSLEERWAREATGGIEQASNDEIGGRLMKISALHPS